MTSTDSRLPEAVNIFTDEFFADPHRTYAQLREQGPVHRVITPNRQRVWLVLGYHEARAAFADPRLSKDAKTAHRVYEKHTDPELRERDFAASLSVHMLNTDPPEHTRLRNLIGRAFTPRTVEQLRPRIRQLAHAHVGRLARQLAEGRTVDLVDELAVPLPTTVICELMGIPEPGRHVLRTAVTDLLSIGDPAVIDQASHQLAALLTDVLQVKRHTPGDDLLTALLAAHDDEDRLSGAELVSMAMLILVAGHETTVNLISGAALAFLRDPRLAHGLLAAPGLLVPAVEELLRHDGPFNISTFRFTTEPVQLGDVEIPAEHPIVISPLAANRDPARYPDPDRLDFNRDARGHLAFGHGVHHCLGTALARAEAYEVFPALLAHLPGWELAIAPAELSWKRSILVRGLQALPVRSTR